MKRLLVICCLLLCLPAFGQRVKDSGNYEGIKWSLSADGTLTVSGRGAIPDFNKYDAPSPNIGDRPWARYRSTVRKLIVQDGVTRVGDRAFQGFEQLQSATFAASVESIGQWAFQNCTALKDVSLPDGIALDNGAFRNTAAYGEQGAGQSSGALTGGLQWGFDRSTGTITSIPKEWTDGQLPSELGGVKVTAIGQWAGNELKIRRLVVPEGVESIGRGAFSGCGELESVSLPRSLKRVDAYAFRGCENLEQVSYAGRESDISFGRAVYSDCLWLHPDFSAPFRASKFYRNLMDVRLTGDYVADAIAIAASQEDYHEGNSFQDLGGGNAKGNKDYTEYNYFIARPEWLWRPGLSEVTDYGGWCGQFCGWCLAMAGVPDAAHQYKNDEPEENYIQWSQTVYAGGDYAIKPGDVLHLRAGHYALVKNVSVKGGVVVVGTWNGNPNVEWIVREFTASSGRNRNYVSGSEKYDCIEILKYEPEVIASLPRHTVSFDPQGGTVSVRRKELCYGAYYGPLPTPEKAGSTFAGWYTADGKRITAYRKANLDGDITLYAHWEGEEAPAGKPVAGGSAGSVSWSLYGDGTLTVSGRGPIPDYNKYGEASPTVSDRPWLKHRDAIRRLVVQEGVTRVGARAFQSFEQLRAVTLAESVQSVGPWAFQNCSALEDVSVPKGIKLENGAFRDVPAEEDLAAVESDGYTGSVYFKRLCTTPLSGNFREDMIKIALSQVGYHEGNSEADYGGGNSRGNGDFTEYGRFLESSGNAWCSEFATWCVRMSGLPKSILGSSRGANAGVFTDGTPSKYYRWNGLSFGGGDYTPQAGDILLWAWDMDSHDADESLGHTSIFRRAEVQGNSVIIYTVEGNNGGKATEDSFTVRKSDGVLTSGDGRLYYLVAPDYENRGIETHLVSFDPAGGTVDRKGKTVAVGGLYGPLPIPRNGENEFLGWYTAPTGGRRVNMYSPVRLQSDQTLYARWASNSAAPAQTIPDRTTPAQTAPARTVPAKQAPAQTGPSDWAATEVMDAARQGVVPSELRGDYLQAITREEFCALMIRLVNKALDTDVTLLFATNGKLDTGTFSDTDDTAVLAAHALGIIKGAKGSQFKPRNAVSRQEAADMLARTAEGLELKASDGTAIAEAVGAKSSGSFTREQAIVAALRLLRKAQK